MYEINRSSAFWVARGARERNIEQTDDRTNTLRAELLRSQLNVPSEPPLKRGAMAIDIAATIGSL